MAPSDRPLISCWRNSDIQPLQVVPESASQGAERAAAALSRQDILEKLELAVLDGDDHRRFWRVPLRVQLGSTGCADEVGLGNGVAQFRSLRGAGAADGVH